MITQSFLKECLSYDPDTGIFTWLKRPVSHFVNINTHNAMNSKLSGKKAGCLEKNGYVYIRINRKNYFAHRLAWLYLFGAWPYLIDHINGIVSDNRIHNLREANSSGNAQNRRKAHSSCGFLGVTKRKENRFEANIKINGNTIYIGCFKTASEAHAAYIAKKRELHPFCTI